MGLLLEVVDAVVNVFQAGRERKPGDGLTTGHKIMVALAIAVGLLAVAVLYLFGFVSLSP